MDAVVANAANDGTLSDFENDVLMIGAVGRIFDAKLYVFEKLRVPEGLEVAAERFLIVRIAFAREDARLQSVAADAAIADKDDAVDDGGGILVGGGGGPASGRFRAAIAWAEAPAAERRAVVAEIGRAVAPAASRMTLALAASKTTLGAWKTILGI